jgi:hypothetical protein
MQDSDVKNVPGGQSVIMIDNNEYLQTKMTWMDALREFGLIYALLLYSTLYMQCQNLAVLWKEKKRFDCFAFFILFLFVFLKLIVNILQ